MNTLEITYDYVVFSVFVLLSLREYAALSKTKMRERFKNPIDRLNYKQVENSRELFILTL